MIALDNGDKIRGDASAATAVDFTLHGLVANIITQLADGQLAASIGDLYTAAVAGVAVTSIVLVNTDSSARTVNLYLTPSGGTARRLVPKNMSLGAGYSLHTDGKTIVVLDTSGQLVLSFSLTNVGVTATAAELNTLDGILATTTELNYVSGVTSALQTQLGLKAPLASPTFTGAANCGSGVLRAIAPDISGVVTAATALTLPAHKLGGTLDADSQQVTNLAHVTLNNENYIYCKNIAGTPIGIVKVGADDALRFYDGGGNQVLTSRLSAVADATDAASVILRLNELLARCRTHGFIAT